VTDLQADPEYRYALRDDAALIRTELGVPMFRGEDILGVIVLYKLEVPPFTDQQVALVETFADQAVITIENVRLFRELAARNRERSEALDRQTATAEILRAISQAHADVQPVFEVIADSSMRLLGAWAASVWAFRQEDNLIRLAAARGGLPGSIAPFMEQRGVPHRPVEGSLSGRTVLTRTVQHILDAHTDPSWSPTFRAEASARGFRSAVAVPMLRGADVVGVIAVTRATAGGFAPAEIDLLQTFADQAVIAVENARLLTELQTKNANLTESLEPQTATSEILRVISSSPTDVHPTFEAIARSARRLCEAAHGMLFRFDGALIHLAAYDNLEADQLQAVRSVFPIRPGHESVTARAILTRSLVHVRDRSEAPNSSTVFSAPPFRRPCQSPCCATESRSERSPSREPRSGCSRTSRSTCSRPSPTSDQHDPPPGRRVMPDPHGSLPSRVSSLQVPPVSARGCPRGPAPPHGAAAR
jgi:two-component system, NtrC family, sensor kinase